jgi:hypothetical protein
MHCPHVDEVRQALSPQTGQHTLWPYFVRILSPGFHAAFPLDTATQGHRCRFRVLRSSCGTALPAARCIGNLYRCDGSAGPAQRRGATIPSLVQTNQIGGHCVGHLPAHLTQKQAMVILIGVSSTSLRLRQILPWLGCSLSTPNTRVPLGPRAPGRHERDGATQLPVRCSTASGVSSCAADEPVRTRLELSPRPCQGPRHSRCQRR